jgi:hypothetical protein
MKYEALAGFYRALAGPSRFRVLQNSAISAVASRYMTADRGGKRRVRRLGPSVCSLRRTGWLADPSAHDQHRGLSISDRRLAQVGVQRANRLLKPFVGIERGLGVRPAGHDRFMRLPCQPRPATTKEITWHGKPFVSQIFRAKRFLTGAAPSSELHSRMRAEERESSTSPMRKPKRWVDDR